jgi:hypothetical protein
VLPRCYTGGISHADKEKSSDVTLPVTTVGNEDTVTVSTVGTFFFRLEVR